VSEISPLHPEIVLQLLPGKNKVSVIIPPCGPSNQLVVQGGNFVQPLSQFVNFGLVLRLIGLWDEFVLIPDSVNLLL